MSDELQSQYDFNPDLAGNIDHRLYNHCWKEHTESQCNGVSQSNNVWES